MNTRSNNKKTILNYSKDEKDYLTRKLKGGKG